MLYEDDASTCRAVGCADVRLDAKGCLRIALSVGPDSEREIPVSFAKVTRGIERSTGVPLVVVEARAEGPAERSSSRSWWLLAVCEGGRAGARRAVAALGRLGAIRTDLHESYGLDASPVGTGNSAWVHRGVEEDADDTASDVSLWDGDEITSESQVAVKFMSTVGCRRASSQSTEALEREIRALVALQGHPNILRFYGIFWLGDDPPGGHRDGFGDRSSSVWPQAAASPNSPPAAGSQSCAGGSGALPQCEAEDPTRPRWAVVTEFCNHGDALNLVRHGLLPEIQVRPFIQAVLEGLQHMHTLGFLHRDVKADNILIAENGRPVLGDLALSCRIDDEVEMANHVGSPGYVAPEIYRRLPYDGRADVFGAGVVLFYMMTATLPFHAETLIKTVRRTLKMEVSMVRYPGLATSSAPCKCFIQQLLQKGAGERPSAEQALQDPWLTGQETQQARQLRWAHGGAAGAQPRPSAGMAAVRRMQGVAATGALQAARHTPRGAGVQDQAALLE